MNSLILCLYLSILISDWKSELAILFVILVIYTISDTKTKENIWKKFTTFEWRWFD